jgi:hypothetical protein
MVRVRNSAIAGLRRKDDPSSRDCCLFFCGHFDRFTNPEGARARQKVEVATDGQDQFLTTRRMTSMTRRGKPHDRGRGQLGTLPDSLHEAEASRQNGQKVSASYF